MNTQTDKKSHEEGKDGHTSEEVMKLRLVNQLYQMYEHHFTGNEEDAWIIVSGIFEGYSRNNFLQQINELTDNQVEEMFMFYVYHKLKEKMEEEGIGYVHNEDDQLLH